MRPCQSTAVCGRVLDPDPPDSEVVAEQDGVRGGPGAALVAEKLHVLDRSGEYLTLKIRQLMGFRAEHGLDAKDLGYRHDRAFAISHNLRLAHTVGVAGWFTALIAHARHNPEHTVTAWWSETRCARHFGDLVRPDAYGHCAGHGHQIEFFLEFDFGTEALARVAGKLTGYARLAAATAITTPILVWLPTTRRRGAAVIS